nr:MAG TPA: hypothetical protein [Caudoviricetes sp.]
MQRNIMFLQYNSTHLTTGAILERVFYYHNPAALTD